MKRAISIILTLAMLVSVAVLPTFASAEETNPYLDDYNVATEAYRFNGTVIHTPFKGTGYPTSPYKWASSTTVKDGNDGTTLNLDGMISEEEWGKPSVYVTSEFAAHSTNQSTQKGATNAKFETPSAENTYYSYNDSAPKSGLKYDLYFMWDDDYLYIACRAYDSDGHGNAKTPSLKGEVDNESSSIWDGDAFQFRVDAEGPNSVVDGHGYDASVIPEGLETGVTRPWASSTILFGDEYYSDVMNVVVAYTSDGNGYTAVYDAANRYNPHDATYDLYDENGNVIGQQPYTAYDEKNLSCYNYASRGTAEPNFNFVPGADGEGRGYIYAVATPVGEAGNTALGKYEVAHETTDYEIAVPWAHVSMAEDFLANVDAGLNLGIATGLLNNKGTRESTYCAYLEWGNGIFPGHMSHDPQTCGGSNLLTLSDTTVAEHAAAACEHAEFFYPTCEDPYVCKACGYERGYNEGHSYKVYEQVLPTEDTAGYAKAKCSTCDDDVTRELAATDAYDYKTFSRNDDYQVVVDNFSSGYTSSWFWRSYKDTDGDGDLDVETDDSGNPVNLGTIRNDDGSQKISYWGAGVTRPAVTIDSDKSECIVNPFDFAVLDFTIDEQTGTYHLVSGIGSSFTFKQDMYILSPTNDAEEAEAVAKAESEGNSSYIDNYHFWFAGEKGIDYEAGLFRLYNEDVWYFGIIKTGYETTAVTLEDFQANAVAYTAVPDGIIKWDDWNEVVFFFDAEANVASLFWNDYLAVGAYDFHFAEGDHDTATSRAFDFQFYTTDINIGTTSRASDYVDLKYIDDAAVTKYSVTVDGTEIGTYAAGEEVTVSATVADGKCFASWTAEGVTLADPSTKTVTFEMPAGNVVLTSAQYYIGDVNMDGAVSISDLFKLKSMLLGETATVTADVDGQNGVTITDLFAMKALLLG